MDIVNKKIADLKPAKYNPRTISEEVLEKLANSLKEFGFVEPIVVNKDMTVIGGHQRLKAAELNGLTEVPCIVVNLDKKREKILNLALNKITGEFDQEKLVEVLAELGDDMSLTGFTESEFQYLQDTADFSPATADADDDDYSSGGGDLPSGEITNENFKLVFYIESENIYNMLHEFFGNKAEHDVEKLIEIVTYWQDKVEKKAE